MLEFVLPHQIASLMRGGAKAGPWRKDELCPSGTPRSDAEAVTPPKARRSSAWMSKKMIKPHRTHTRLQYYEIYRPWKTTVIHGSKISWVMTKRNDLKFCPLPYKSKRGIYNTFLSIFYQSWRNIGSIQSLQIMNSPREVAHAWKVGDNINKQTKKLLYKLHGWNWN